MPVTRVVLTGLQDCCRRADRPADLIECVGEAVLYSRGGGRGGVAAPPRYAHAPLRGPRKGATPRRVARDARARPVSRAAGAGMSTGPGPVSASLRQCDSTDSDRGPRPRSARTAPPLGRASMTTRSGRGSSAAGYLCKAAVREARRTIGGPGRAQPSGRLGHGGAACRPVLSGAGRGHDPLLQQRNGRRCGKNRRHAEPIRRNRVVIASRSSVLPAHPRSSLSHGLSTTRQGRIACRGQGRRRACC